MSIMTSSSQITILRGTVAPLPPGSPCKVCLVDGDREYNIIPRGAGADLVDLVSAQLEVTGTVKEEEESFSVQVRSYKVLDADDEAWA